MSLYAKKEHFIDKDGIERNINLYTARTDITNSPYYDGGTVFTVRYNTTTLYAFTTDRPLEYNGIEGVDTPPTDPLRHALSVVDADGNIRYVMNRVPVEVETTLVSYTTAITDQVIEGKNMPTGGYLYVTGSSGSNGSSGSSGGAATYSTKDIFGGGGSGGNGGAAGKGRIATVALSNTPENPDFTDEPIYSITAGGGYGGGGGGGGGGGTVKHDGSSATTCGVGGAGGYLGYGSSGASVKCKIPPNTSIKIATVTLSANGSAGTKGGTGQAGSDYSTGSGGGRGGAGGTAGTGNGGGGGGSGGSISGGNGGTGASANRTGTITEDISGVLSVTNSTSTTAQVRVVRYHLN